MIPGRPDTFENTGRILADCDGGLQYLDTYHLHLSQNSMTTEGNTAGGGTISSKRTWGCSITAAAREADDETFGVVSVSRGRLEAVLELAADDGPASLGLVKEDPAMVDLSSCELIRDC